MNNTSGAVFDEVELKRVETNEDEESGFIATEVNHTCKKI